MSVGVVCPVLGKASLEIGLERLRVCPQRWSLSPKNSQHRGRELAALSIFQHPVEILDNQVHRLNL